jgi:hypothetical protein
MNLKRTAAASLRPRGVVLSLIIVVASASLAFGQAKPNVSVEHVSFPNFPVQVIGFEVAGATHELVESPPRRFSANFDSSDGWLRRIAFKVKNRSDKVVVSVMLNGTLAVGEEGEVPMGIDVRYGQELDESSFGRRAPRGEPRRLAPGETADVRWSDEEYDQLAKFLSTKHPVDSYRKMRMDVSEVRFADGTVWAQGRLFRIDPLDPRKWTPLDKASKDLDEPTLDRGASERIVEVSPSKPDPDQKVLVISEIKVAGQPVTPGRPFAAAGADWLRSLTVRIKNVSAKPIACVRIYLSLPEARYHAGGAGFQFLYGGEAPADGRCAADTKPLLPGEESELSFTDDSYEVTRKFAQGLSGVTDFSRVRLGTADVVFGDGTHSLVMNPAGSLKANAPAGAN